MKLHILSDLHIEFVEFAPPQTESDVVVLAGDIGVGLSGLNWASAYFKNTPVVYVPGNHEYYHHDLTLINDLKASAPDNFHVLNNEEVIIGGVRFLCSVLWTDFALFGEADRFFSMQKARQTMPDFSVIQSNGNVFTPEESIRLHEESRVWLTERLEEPFDGKTVVVTHHAPSSKSVAPRFGSDLLTPAFASHLETLMDASQPTLWIHGHMHDSFDYEIYETRVICNPRGYPEEANLSGFVPDLTIEI